MMSLYPPKHLMFHKVDYHIVGVLPTEFKMVDEVVHHIIEHVTGEEASPEHQIVHCIVQIHELVDREVSQHNNESSENGGQDQSEWIEGEHMVNAMHHEVHISHYPIIIEFLLRVENKPVKRVLDEAEEEEA